MRDISLHFLCLQPQIRATHWISFSVRSLFICNVCFFFFLMLCLPWQCIHQRLSPHGQVCSAISRGTKSQLPFAALWGEKKQMNVSKQQVIPSFLSWRIQKKMQKCCECMIESVTCRTAHFWQFCLPKEYNCIEERREICCIVYKVMFIQYFNITSDFRGRYLNRILYLHVKCQQQFIDIVLPFIIRVLIVFLIFV